MLSSWTTCLKCSQVELLVSSALKATVEKTSYFLLIISSDLRFSHFTCWPPHHFFVRTTNYVTINHYFVRALYLCFQLYFLCLITLFFKFRHRHVIKYDLNVFKMHFCAKRKIWVAHILFVRATHFSLVFLFYS